MAKKKAPNKKAPAKKSASQKAAKKAPAAADREESAASKHLENVLQEMTAKPEKTRVEQWSPVQCPYCGEEFEVHVTSESDGQTMVEDCEVCCRPISLHIHLEDDELQVSAYRS